MYLMGLLFIKQSIYSKIFLSLSLSLYFSLLCMCKSYHVLHIPDGYNKSNNVQGVLICDRIAKMAPNFVGRLNNTFGTKILFSGILCRPNCLIFLQNLAPFTQLDRELEHHKHNQLNMANLYMLKRSFFVLM